MIEAKHYSEVRLVDWRWPHFTPKELACRFDGSIRMDPAFLDLLERLREAYRRPMVVTSGYRSPSYNATVSTTGPSGPHTTGRAVDVAAQGTDAYELLWGALACGFTGIGVKQNGASRFLHLDNLTRADNFPRPWIWSYP